MPHAQIARAHVVDDLSVTHAAEKTHDGKSATAPSPQLQRPSGLEVRAGSVCGTLQPAAACVCSLHATGMAIARSGLEICQLLRRVPRFLGRRWVAMNSESS